MASGGPRNTNPDTIDGLESPPPQSKKNQAQKPKAGSSKKMTSKEQSERFVETARELGTDELGVDFDQALDFILYKERTIQPD